LNLYDIDQNVSSIVGKIKTIDYLVIGIINHLLISEDIQYFTDKEGKQHRQAWTYGAIGINIRIVDVETGEVVYSGSKKCVERLSGDIKEAGVENAANKAMANTLVKFEKELLNAFPLKGYIITIESAEKAIIDIGTEFSVKKGDKFLVFRPGKIIVHPVTNKELFSPRKEIAEAKVISADINTSLVEIKLKDKTLKIETGDYVVEKEKKRSFGEFIEEGLEPGRGQ